MYNLLVHASGSIWDDDAVVLDASRYLEYTNEDLAKRLKTLNESTINQLMSVPAVFAYETGNDLPARVGWIKSIQKKDGEIRIKFEFDKTIAPITEKKLKELDWDLDIGKMEMHRTHWAVKTSDLPEVLAAAGFVKKPAELVRAEGGAAKKKKKSSAKQKGATKKPRVSKTKAVKKPGKPKVFIVHGHETLVKADVAKFLAGLGLEPIILHERPNGGRTLITKFQEESSDVKFAVVLMTPDDVGGKKDGPQRPRPRQNVIFELGFFIGKLGSPMVCALFTDDVEKPSDFDAVVYISYGADTPWKEELARELRHAHVVAPALAEAAENTGE